MNVWRDWRIRRQLLTTEEALALDESMPPPVFDADRRSGTKGRRTW
jgi:hypothetical protein